MNFFKRMLTLAWLRYTLAVLTCLFIAFYFLTSIWNFNFGLSISTEKVITHFSVTIAAFGFIFTLLSQDNSKNEIKLDQKADFRQIQSLLREATEWWETAVNAIPKESKTLGHLVGDLERFMRISNDYKNFKKIKAQLKDITAHTKFKDEYSVLLESTDTFFSQLSSLDPVDGQNSVATVKSIAKGFKDLYAKVTKHLVQINAELTK